VNLVKAATPTGFTARRPYPSENNNDYRAGTAARSEIGFTVAFSSALQSISSILLSPRCCDWNILGVENFCIFSVESGRSRLKIAYFRLGTAASALQTLRQKTQRKFRGVTGTGHATHRPAFRFSTNPRLSRPQTTMSPGETKGDNDARV
jgi:hypothetical protein